MESMLASCHTLQEMGDTYEDRVINTYDALSIHNISYHIISHNDTRYFDDRHIHMHIYYNTNHGTARGTSTMTRDTNMTHIQFALKRTIPSISTHAELVIRIFGFER